VPLKLLHDAESHIVTVELKNGEIYRGLLAEVEDTMNCQMKEGNYFIISAIIYLIYYQYAVTMTARDGRILKMENVFLRGGLVKFFVLPEMLKSAPIFKKVQTMRNKKIESSKPMPKPGGKSEKKAKTKM
jgi:small nuclear ribonucleoprotein D3